VKIQGSDRERERERSKMKIKAKRAEIIMKNKI